MALNAAEVQSSELLFMTDEELERADQDRIDDELGKVMNRLSEYQVKIEEANRALQSSRERTLEENEQKMLKLTEESGALRSYHEKLCQSWHSKEELDRKVS